MKIPYDQLSPEALDSIIAQFVSRDGPDSGHVDVSFEHKVERVKNQLKSGSSSIFYDNSTQSCNIVSKDDPFIKNLL